MRPEGRDAAELWDMLDAATAARAFTADVTLDRYLSDAMRRAAVERQTGILGEAARRVSAAFRAAHPEIPWAGIIAQRTVLIHEYGAIDHVRLWRVVTEHVPALIAALERLVPPSPPDPEPD